MKNKLNKIIKTAIFIMPIILGTFFVIKYGTNVPIGDDWTFVSVLDDFYSGTMQFKQLCYQHNEHRVFFPFAFKLLICKFTNYNTKIEMIVIQFMFLLILIIITIELKMRLSFKWRDIPFLIIPISFLLYSWRQYENFLWGWQITFLTPVLFTIITFFLLSKFIHYFSLNRKNKYLFLILSLITAVISTFSSFAGLMVWFVGIVQMSLMLKGNKMILKYIFFWILFGGACWYLYFMGYKKPGGHPDVFYILHHPYSFINFFLTIVGNGAFSIKRLAFIAGLFVFALFLTTVYRMVKKGNLLKNNFFIAGCLYFLSVLFVISIGRAGFGIAQAMCSRYATFSLLFVIFVYIIFVLEFECYKKGGVINILIGIVLISCILFSSINTIDGCRKGKIYKDELKEHLLKYKSAPNDKLVKLFPSVVLLKRRAAILEKYRLNVFYQK